ncbi:ComEC family competence protein [Rhodobacteraceae bacterium M382]|nr:ComEC family competence protein [Rhodobacteraceae bacterium M382]
MRLIAALDSLIMQQRGHLFPWVPVLLAIGIGLYFSRLTEPGMTTYAGTVGFGVLAMGVALRWPGGLAALVWAVALVAFGFGLAGLRAHRVAGPVLDWRYYGPIEGRVVGLDRSSTDAPRVTLDQVYLERVRPDRRPIRVRLSLHGPPETLLPGTRVMTTGHLMPPQGPAEPGGFDFRRHAWFQGLGAVGYTRNPVLISAPSQAGQRVFKLRMAASRAIRQVLPGDVGGFAAAVTTGDRSGVSQTALQALRDSNLAHLLAISGLHMGLLAGFVFGLLRVGLSLIPSVALRLPVKRIAAAGALGVAAGYLVLSGGNVATERAFVMVAVALGAVMVDRRVFSLRAVALAALIVLVRRPETLLGPGFQMSFAATTALVAVFGWIREAEISLGPPWLQPILGVVISSAVAGAATGPVGAAHFNAMAHYGLIANLVSVPLMGVLVIPAAVAALCLWPIGLGWIGLKVMGWGLAWILEVARVVAGLDGAKGYVVSPDPVVLPLIGLGFLVIILWQGRLRGVGLVPVVLGFALWTQTVRPEVLIDANGALVGVMTDQGRALSKPKGAGFVAGIWLENDGDGADQTSAASRWDGHKTRIRRMRLGQRELVHVIGKRAVADFQECKANQIVVASVPMDLQGPCAHFDPAHLRETGSISVTDGQLKTARQISGTRLWTGF